MDKYIFEYLIKISDHLNEIIEVLLKEMMYAVRRLQEQTEVMQDAVFTAAAIRDIQFEEFKIIDMLYQIIERLENQKKVLSQCSNDVINFCERNEAYPLPRGTMHIFGDDILHMVANLEMVSKDLYREADEIVKALDNEIHIQPALRKVNLSGLITDYYVASYESSEIYRKASGRLKIMWADYAIREESRDNSFEDDCMSGVCVCCKAMPKIPEKNEVTVPTPRIDSVQFSAIAPEKVETGKYLPVHVVMYEDEFRGIIDEIKNSERILNKVLKAGYYDVERNTKVKVILSSPNIDIDDNEEERVWCGKFLDFEFVVLIPDDYNKSQIVFHAAVYINDLIATKLKLILECAQQPGQNFQIVRTDFMSAFVSYASSDRSRVAAIIQGMKKARPDMDLFFDVESLHSGQRWEEVLKHEIENRDILFLCWSKAASKSKWVDKEWRYAYEIKGEECIEPIPIDPPEECPPPHELQQKHFNDMMLFIIKK